MIDVLVSDSFVPSSSTVPLDDCLVQCDIDFDDDALIREVNELLNPIMLMDATNDIDTIELLPYAKVTHVYSHGELKLENFKMA